MEILHTADIATPFGQLRIASSARGLCYVELPGSSGRGMAGWMSRQVPDGRMLEGFAPNRSAAAQILEFLEGKRKRFDLVLDLRGTGFQLEVYEHVSAIPYGETITYSEIARAMGGPRTVRAVGAANGANPLALVIPCHRVVGKSGRLRGYGGGLEMKARLLALESGSPREGWLL